MLLRASLLTLSAVVPLFAQSAGIPVRSAPTDYDTRNVVDGITVAASAVPPEQVKKLFSKDLNHEGYLVVEVAVWPAAGALVDVSPDEFTLRVGSNSTILQSQTPAQIAAGDKRGMSSKTMKPPELPGNVHVYNTATIGYESGDARNGRPGGVYTGGSTTVGVGNPPYPQGPPPSQPMPRAAKPDWTAAKQEMEDKELPPGRITARIAGYLYFLKAPTKEKRPDYELAWYRTAGQIRLSIPSPK